MESLTSSQREYVARNRNLNWLPVLTPVQRSLLEWMRVHNKSEASDIFESMNARAASLRKRGLLPANATPR